MNLIQASTKPRQDLEVVAYEGQPPENRIYKEGYEDFLESMPILNPEEPLNDVYVNVSSSIMTDLADKLMHEPWVLENSLGKNEFSRTIIGMQNPHTKVGIKEGVELLVAKWGEGFESPIHGHANGLLHEDLLYGEILVNTYSVVNNKTVRPYMSKVFTNRDNIVSGYFNGQEGIDHPRPNLVHNFRTISNSATLHYVAEHTRDGRDNGFEVEYFDEVYDLSDKVTRITSRQAYMSQVGDVILVRSQNVPHYGDHFIAITGAPVAKAHGIRPQDHAVQASQNSILNDYEPETGLILLKLNKEACQEFFKFHNINL